MSGIALLAMITPLPAAATIPPSELEGRIVFTRWGGFNNGFFIADADGSDEQRLVPIPPGDLCCLQVARDGSRASISARLPGGKLSVAVVDLADLSTVVLDPPSDTLNTDGGPFSPDGTQIAYTVFPSVGPGINVYVGPADDPTAAVQIVPTEPLPADVGVLFAMDYSPDGRQLLLYVPEPGDTTNVHGSLAIIDVDGSGYRPLTPEGIDVPCCAHWSPDGTSIVFAARDGRLLTIHPDGSGLTEVYSEADRWADHPNWSPDGSRIIFSLNTDGGSQQPLAQRSLRDQRRRERVDAGDRDRRPPDRGLVGARRKRSDCRGRDGTGRFRCCDCPQRHEPSVGRQMPVRLVRKRCR